MKNLIKFLLLSILIFSLASCGEINEEMWLNKDGSGKLEYQFDVGESLPMIMMMAQGAAQQQMGEMENGEKAQEKMGEIMERISSEKLDTSFNFFEIMPDSVRRITDNPEQFKNMNIFIDVDSDESKALLKLAIDFDSFKNIDQMLGNLMNAFGGNRPELANINLSEVMGSFDDSNYFTKMEFKQRKMSNGDSGEMSQMMEEGEGAQMVEMMFGDTKLNKIIHFPYTVKSVSGADATIDGNTIYITKDFMDSMKEGQGEDLEVMFKKKFLGIF